MPSVMHQPLDGRDHRLHPRPAVVAPGVARVLGPVEPALGQARADLGEVQAAGEVIAVAVEHAGAEVVVGLEAVVGPPELLEHLDVEGVALGGAVEGHQQHVVPPRDLYDGRHSWERSL